MPKEATQIWTKTVVVDVGWGWGGESIGWALGTAYDTSNQDRKVLDCHARPKRLMMFRSLLCRIKLHSIRMPWQSPRHNELLK